MATQSSVPQLINKAFAGNAAADIERRISAGKESVEAKLRAEFDAKLAEKVDVQAFTEYTNSAPTGNTGVDGSIVTVIDNGDGTLTIG